MKSQPATLSVRTQLLALASMLVLCGYAATQSSPAVHADPASPSAASRSNPSHCGTPFGIGYRLIAFKSARKAALWYPSSSTQAPFAYSKDISTTLAHDGAPLTACGRFPLVVFAHGLLGCGAQSIFFTEELARFGYVVIAPDYRDALLCRLGSSSWSARPVREPSVFKPQDWTDATYADRKTDTHDVITLALHNPIVAPIINPDEIGIAGHSLGGYTAMGVVGGWSSWDDPRIKAALLMSPYSLPFSVTGTIKLIGVPLMYQGGELDVGITPFLEGPNGAYANSYPPKYFVKLRGSNHFEWSNAVCTGEPTIHACLAAPRNARLIDAYGIAFFEKHLKGKDEPLLRGRGAGLSAYAFEEARQGILNTEPILAPSPTGNRKHSTR